MALHREIDGSEPLRPEPVESVTGRLERRRAESSWEMAMGTFACPGCDAPVLPASGGMSPGDDAECGYCGHQARVRDFLSLGEPTRPTRVTVRAWLVAPR